MADLATALQTALNKTKEKQMATTHTTEDVKKIAREWDKDAQPVKAGFKVTNNVSRSTFDLIKANPGCKRQDIVNLATKQNFNPTSVSSLIAQFTRIGHVRKDENGRLYVTQNEFTPVKHKELREAQNKARKERVKRIKAAKQALSAAKKKAKAAAQQERPPVRIVEPKPVAAPAASASLSSFDADQLLSTLSFTQAMSLYKKLKTMLGEA